MRPETAVEAEKGAEEKAEEVGDEAASQGASEADDALKKTAEAEAVAASGREEEEAAAVVAFRLATPTLSRNSALRVPMGLRHPRATSPPASSANAGPGTPAPQGQVSGSAASGELALEQAFCGEKSSTTPRTVYPRLPEASA